MAIPILFEDNHLLVIEKPVNMPVQKDKSNDLDVQNALKAYIKEKYQKPGNVYLGIVHRLDRPVGGVMIFAKTSKAASRLSNAITKQEINRKYLTVVHGEPQESSRELTNYLIKNRQTNQSYVVNNNHPKGKKAVLNYSTQTISSNYSLLKVQLHTGRSHQIRVQLAHMGHPIYGDQKYGAHLNTAGNQLALWSNEISFFHPVTKEPLHFISHPPNHFPWNQF